MRTRPCPRPEREPGRSIAAARLAQRRSTAPDYRAWADGQRALHLRTRHIQPLRHLTAAADNLAACRDLLRPTSPTDREAPHRQIVLGASHHFRPSDRRVTGRTGSLPHRMVRWITAQTSTARRPHQAATGPACATQRRTMAGSGRNVHPGRAAGSLPAALTQPARCHPVEQPAAPASHPSPTSPSTTCANTSRIPPNGSATSPATSPPTPAGHLQLPRVMAPRRTSFGDYHPCQRDHPAHTRGRRSPN